MLGNYEDIYNRVAASGIPNAEGCRIPLPSDLKFQEWDRYTTNHEDDEFILSGIKYGFSMEYLGSSLPISIATENHASARNFPDTINSYIEKESRLGAVIRSFSSPPFEPCHISPMMTRPKNSPGERRVIVDLSFPDGGVNAWVVKGYSKGSLVSHTLPTVHQAVEQIVNMKGSPVFLSSIDISRAYRNFRICPRHWPLLGIYHEDQIYIDTALPFGARMSSFYMQKVAEYVCRALKSKGITGLM